MFQDISYKSILKRMLDRIPNNFDKREGSIIYDALAPCAMELMNMYISLNTVLKETFGDTASRDFLILRAKERGLSPELATHAILKALTTPKDIDIKIGSRFSLDVLNYVVTEKIKDGEYKVKCESLGRVGNSYYGEMISIDYIRGLEKIEIVELLIPGEDEEDTEDLRTRYFGSFNEKSFGGNVRDYLEKTNAIPGVGSTKVTRVWNNDLRPAEMIPSAAVQAWFNTIKSTLTGEVAAWLETVYDAALNRKLTTGGTVLLTILNSDFGVASDTLIKTVQQTIDPDEYAGEGYGVAPIGHIVKVESAETKTVTVKTNIVFDVGYGWSNLQSSINDAISNYLLELRKSWADNPYLVVRISQIETRLLNIKGIVDIGNTKINGASDNLTLGEFEVPVFGGASA